MLPLQAEAVRYFPLVDRLALGLDVGTRLYPRLSLELHLDQQPSQDRRWERLLARLHTAGLCTADQLAALLAWEGQLSPHQTPIPFPIRWRLRAGLMGQKLALVRGLSHLKIVYQAGQAPHLKAYFGYKAVLGN
jgi:hypothetical protein